MAGNILRPIFLALAAAVAVSAASQTITFDAIPNQIFGISPFQITAKASSGLPVTFSSTTPGVCKVASGLVMLLSPGSCSITVSQGGNGTYSSAAPATQNFTVSRARPSSVLVPFSGVEYATGKQPFAIVVADFNRDGFPDLATADAGSSDITILLGNGSGGFTPAPGSPTALGAVPDSITVGDFNGDGIPDIAATCIASNSVTILLGNGSGGFTAVPGSPFGAGLNPVGVAVGDFNGDGMEDLAIADQAGENQPTNNVTVLLGNGSGGFTPSNGSPFATGGAGPSSLAVGDFNGDGLQDLAVANSAGNSVSVLLGNGIGGFAAAPGSPFNSTWNGPDAVAVGDFNSDGIADLAVADAGGSAVVFLGDGKGRFSADQTGALGPGVRPSGLALADFDGNGTQDFAVVSSVQPGNDFGVEFLGNGAGGFAATGFLPFGPNANPAPYAIAAGDFNGDGIEDIATADPTGNSVTVLLGGPLSTTSALSTTSPVTINVGQAVPLTLTVSSDAPAVDTNGGTATFYDGATDLGTSSQTASPYMFTAANLSAGSHTFTAKYTAPNAFVLNSSSNAITIQVNAKAQSISFAQLGNMTYGSSPPPLSATATSGLTVTFTSNSPSICAVTGTTLTLLAAGTCSVTASQTGNSMYAAASPVNQTFIVTQASQTIAFGPISPVTLPSSGIALVATSTSGLPVSFASSTPVVCTVNGTTVTPVTAGTCTIVARQSGNVNYAAAPAVTQSFAILAGLTILPGSLSFSSSFGGAPATQTVTLTYQTSAANAPAFSSSISIAAGSGWLSVSPASGTMTQTSVANSVYTYSATVTVQATPGGNAAGAVYGGTAVFSVAGETVSLPVSMSIAAQPLPQPTSGIANAASASQAPPSVVSLGSYVAIYGTLLAGSGNPSAPSTPLPTTLNGTQISLGGLPMPLLYAASGQLNALVPQGLAPNRSYPLVVTTGTLQSAPVMLSVVELQPGIYTVNTSGSGPGIVANAFTGQLNSSSNPAHVSDFLVIYCTGLGLLQPSNGQMPPADGVAAPLSPTFQTAATVTATIGGINAPVSFSGLTATFAGLYQVNVQVPAGVSTGSSVPLVITATDSQTGAIAQSNSVTIVVQ